MQKSKVSTKYSLLQNTIHTELEVSMCQKLTTKLYSYFKKNILQNLVSKLPCCYIACYMEHLKNFKKMIHKA